MLRVFVPSSPQEERVGPHLGWEAALRAWRVKPSPGGLETTMSVASSYYFGLHAPKLGELGFLVN